MAKKTRVTLPGSLSDLVKDLQNGEARNAQQNAGTMVAEERPQQEKEVVETKKEEVKAQAPSPTPQGNAAQEQPDREYNIVKDDTRDSWNLFLDMAKQYKDGGGKLATIYIDSQLKNVLDRMKYAGPEKLSTSAILSSIVARFIYDHEAQIRKALFSGDLI